MPVTATRSSRIVALGTSIIDPNICILLPKSVAPSSLSVGCVGESWEISGTGVVIIVVRR